MAVEKFSLKGGLSVKLKSNNIFRKKKISENVKKMKCLTSTTIFPALTKGIGYFIFDFPLYDFSWMGNAESGRWLSLHWRWKPQDQKDEFYLKPCLQSQTHLGKEGPLAVSGPTSCSSFQGQAPKIKSVCSGHFLVELWRSLRMGSPTPCPSHTHSSFQPSGSVPWWKMS